MTRIESIPRPHEVRDPVREGRDVRVIKGPSSRSRVGVAEKTKFSRSNA